MLVNFGGGSCLPVVGDRYGLNRWRLYSQNEQILSSVAAEHLFRWASNHIELRVPDTTARQVNFERLGMDADRWLG